MRFFSGFLSLCLALLAGLFCVGTVSASGISARARIGGGCGVGGVGGVTYLPQQSFAPVYGPSYTTGSCGQAALFGQQFYPPSFAIQPRVFSAPVYVQPAFVQPTFIGGAGRGINVNVNRGFFGRTRVNVNAGF